ncbi:MAG TPA: MbnP family copper-binding protein [Polyangiales bacterium]|nr:MbnP family copper-binding protein [Polyangiales bacterium]
MFALCLVAGCDDDDLDLPEAPLDAGPDAAKPDAAVVADGGLDAGPNSKRIELKFAARLTDKGELECGKAYAGQGTAGSEVTPKDFRFFVESVKLKATTGEEVPLVFDDLTTGFQTKEVALIDFTTTGGECEGGPLGSNLSIKGSVPANLTYNGVKVVIGVPESLNHSDPVTAPAPLQAPGASWDWVFGYRFLIAEVLATSQPDAGTHHGDALDAGAHHSAGDAGGDHGGTDPGLGFVHLGSTGCTKSGDVISCINQNRAEFTLSSFDPDRDQIVADLGAVFQTADLSSVVQCHGMGASCAPMFGQLGVDIATGKPSGVQKVFSVSSQR